MGRAYGCFWSKDGLLRHPFCFLLFVVVAFSSFAVSASSPASAATAKGYWLVAADGGVFSFGGAQFFGSTGGIKLNKPIVAMAPTPDGEGYWLVASDGGIFAYGDARFYGSTGAMPLNKPIVGMAPTPSGHGYWLVASDGGIFAYGDAQFYGSLGGTRLNAPIVGIAATTDGMGYWLAARDGGIFNYGDASFQGSFAGAGDLQPPSQGVLGIMAAGSGYIVGYGPRLGFNSSSGAHEGEFSGIRRVNPTDVVGAAFDQSSLTLWQVGADGGVFGLTPNATFYGSMGGMRLNSPIVGMAAMP